MYAIAHTTQGCAEGATTTLQFSSSLSTNLTLRLRCNQPLQAFASLLQGTHLNSAISDGRPQSKTTQLPGVLVGKAEALSNVWEKKKGRQKTS